MDQSRSVDASPEPPPFGDVDSDAELLNAFAAATPGSTAAQAVLTQIVARHGAMVYQVAHRMVCDPTLVDDVFQATFLVLAQSARKIQKTASLASWLHGTARNIGRRALNDKYGVRSQTTTGAEMVTAVEDDPFTEMIRSHERQLLDEELQQLPEIYRAPLVLHYFEQRTNQEISQWLGITVAAVESRLKRAKLLLRARLVRRGITLSVAVAALGASSSLATATPSVALVTSTISLAATTPAISASLTAITASAVLQLTAKELATMSATNKIAALLLTTAGTLTLGGAVLFGAVYGGLNGKGQRTATVSAEPDGVIESDSKFSDLTDDFPATLLTQTDPATDQRLQVEKPLASDKEAATTSVKTPIQATIEGGAELQATPDSETIIEGGETRIKARDSSVDVNVAPGNGASLLGDSGSEHRTQILSGIRNLSAADRKVYEALDQAATLEFPDNLIGEFTDYISALKEIRIRVDWKTLSNEGITRDATRVTLMLNEAPLSTSLSLLLESVDGVELDYYVDGGMLIITTAEKAREKKCLRFYDLSCELENLPEVIEKYAKGFQMSEGGVLELTSFGDCLAIETSFAIHKKIEEMIVGVMQVAEARKAAGKEFVIPKPEKPRMTPQSPTPAVAPAPQPGGAASPAAGGFGGGFGGGGGGFN